MDQAKVLEYLSQSLMTEYLQKLITVKMKKLVLFPVFPYTAAPNWSEPQYFAAIENPAVLVSFSKADLS